MTPREKAIELTDRYLQCIIFTIKQEIKVSVIEAAKQCALILVNEIIIELQDFAFNNDIEDYGIENYWEEVKEQISIL